MDKIRYNRISDVDNYDKIIENFISTSSIKDVLLLSRYSYTHCEQSLLSDQDYDELIKLPQVSYMKNIPYEQDRYTSNVMNIINLLEIGDTKKKKKELSKEEQELLDMEHQDLINSFPQNQSMPYYGTVDEVILNLPGDGLEYLISYKHDGWNISCYYVPGEKQVKYAHTRGRDSAEVSDCTELLRTLAPELEVNRPIKVIGELVLRREKFNELKYKYPSKQWVNIRSSISTFIAGNIPKDYWDALEFKAFGIQGMHNMTREEQFNFLEEKGFKVPRRAKVRGYAMVRKALEEVIPKDYTENYYNSYECDGITVALNDIGDTPTIVAYKGGVWGSEILISRIKSFYFSRNSKRFTPIAKIEPVVSRIGNTITNVPLVNLARIRDYKLNVGDRIEIEYQSQQNVYFKDKIKDLTDKDVEIEWGEK